MRQIQKAKLYIYLFYLSVFILLLTYNIFTRSLWVIDAFIGLFVITIFFYYSKKLNLGAVSIFFLGLSFLLHSLGTFDTYNILILFFGYDKIVHFVASLTGVMIVAKIVYSKLMQKGEIKLSLNKHMLILVAIVSFILLIGVLNEFFEFIGFTYFGAPWPGMFSPMDLQNTILDNYYIDTIHDLFIDIVGAGVGAIGVFFFSGMIKTK